MHTYLPDEPRRIGEAATNEQDSAASPMSICCIDSDVMVIITMMNQVKCFALVKASSYGSPNTYYHP